MTVALNFIISTAMCEQNKQTQLEKISIVEIKQAIIGCHLN